MVTAKRSSSRLTISAPGARIPSRRLTFAVEGGYVMGDTYTINVEPLGRTVECPADQAILDACLRAGVRLPHACTHGTCSTCKVQVLEGDVNHNAAGVFAPMEPARHEGQPL